ncbi:MAG: galactose-1-phosphate uridylyltransferase [Proteobacteria bacterium]|nr:galactose-1-phosphate uridylyltransferase [Pseudomonadota bacterium]
MPELRKDPIVSRWVIISTERSKRPINLFSAKERAMPEAENSFCPFDPGHETDTPHEVLSYRTDGGGQGAASWTLRVVPNKFPALMIEGELGRRADGIYDKMNGIGAHEVIIETPNHNEQLADLSDERFQDVLWAYRDRIIDLKKDTRFRYILIFKNHGLGAGASLDHSHSQLIALPIIPKSVAEEMSGSKNYYDYKERCIFCDIVSQEIDEQKRVVGENEDFIAVCPYAPRFPFETWILPKKHRSHYEDCTKNELKNLAGLFQRTLHRLNKALDVPPYNFMLHTSPVGMPALAYYHWHIEITPRITRVAGFERGSGFYINPTAPEVSAQFLKELGLP